MGSAETDAWLERVFVEQRDKIFRVCLRFGGGDRDWALDRCQDVFMKLTERAAEVQRREDPGGWLYRVAVTTCCMQLRRERTWGRLRAFAVGDPEELAPSALGEVHARRELQRLAPVLRALPVKQLAITVLVDIEGKSQDEAAALLGLSKGQVSKLHRRTRDGLRAQGWEVGDG